MKCNTKNSRPENFMKPEEIRTLLTRPEANNGRLLLKGCSDMHGNIPEPQARILCAFAQ
jgi:hypothetical protein